MGGASKQNWAKLSIWPRLVLSAVMAAAPVLPRAGAQQPPKPKLQILIIEGEGAINNIKQRTAREPIVEVRDENDKPVAGAAVVFTLPGTGASGSFANGSQILMVTTNEQGRAVATGLRPNNLQGQFQMRVTASHQGQTASANISMQNAALGVAGPAAAAGHGKLIAVLAGIGAAVGVGVAVGLSGGDDTPAARPPIAITPGTGTVGGR
jgi:hypothetical protein